MTKVIDGLVVIIVVLVVIRLLFDAISPFVPLLLGLLIVGFFAERIYRNMREW